MVKIDFTALFRVGLTSSFRFSSGARINNASIEFGFERIGDNAPEPINSASWDAELLPFDFVLNNGSHGYAFAGVGPHLLAWPWVAGAESVGKVIKFLAWNADSTTKMAGRPWVPLPVVNAFLPLQLGIRARYNNERKCIERADEMGVSLWLWHVMQSLTTSSRDFSVPGRGITLGASQNYKAEFQLFSKAIDGTFSRSFSSLFFLKNSPHFDAMNKKKKKKQCRSILHCIARFGWLGGSDTV